MLGKESLADVCVGVSLLELYNSIMHAGAGMVGPTYGLLEMYLKQERDRVMLERYTDYESQVFLEMVKAQPEVGKMIVDVRETAKRLAKEGLEPFPQKDLIGILYDADDVFAGIGKSLVYHHKKSEIPHSELLAVFSLVWLSALWVLVARGDDGHTKDSFSQMAMEARKVVATPSA